MDDINLLLDKALAEVANLKDGEEFTLRDLFKGYEWNRISRGDRITLGTIFLNHVKKDSEIEHIGKNASGQWTYKKKAVGSPSER